MPRQWGRRHGARAVLQTNTRKCYIKALAIDDQHAQAWYNLGIQGVGTVLGQTFMGKECYIKALTIDD